MNLRRFLVGLFLLCSLIHCSASDEEKIAKVTDRIERSINERNLSNFLETFSPNYLSEPDKTTFKEIEMMSQHVFENWKDLTFTITEKSIYVTGNEARVVLNYFVEGLSDGQRKSYPAKRSIRLILNGKKWQIVDGFLLEPLYSYSSPEKENIRKLMENRAMALTNKDLEAYLSCFSPNYFDPIQKTNFNTIKEEIIQRFRNWQTIRFQITDMEITIKGKSATVNESFVLSGIRGQNQEEKFPPGRELFHLAQTDQGQWQIVGGL